MMMSATRSAVMQVQVAAGCSSGIREVPDDSSYEIHDDGAYTRPWNISVGEEAAHRCHRAICPGAEAQLQ